MERSFQEFIRQIELNDYYVSSFYAIDPKTGKKINVTGCKIDDFKAWATASKMMENIDCRSMSKADRQTLFEVNLAILKKIIF